MPLSWLPLISDYTREAKNPVEASVVSAVVYGVVSCFMYLIGMGAAIYTGEYDISLILIQAGLGVVGAVLFPMDDITDFLYFIGSVFAPMIAVQFADYFILKKVRTEKSIFS